MAARSRLQLRSSAMTRTSFPRHKLRIALLENIHPAAREALADVGYTVEVLPKALEGDELAAVLADAHVVGCARAPSCAAPSSNRRRS